MSNTSGKLYIVATPIGNLGDISARAAEVLGSVATVAAEDTRVSRQLFTALAISPQSISVHEHNEEQRLPGLIEQMLSGEDVALISDAGTPLVSDPGYRLVAAAHDAGIAVVPVPGASALIAALSASGLPSDRFCFDGFLPRKSAARRERFALAEASEATMIWYESAHRIEAAIEDLLAVCGDARQAALARELTKRFETIKRGNPQQLLDYLQADSNHQRGEFVLLLAPKAEAAGGTDDSISVARLIDSVRKAMPPSKGAKLLAEIVGGDRRDWYQKLENK